MERSRAAVRRPGTAGVPKTSLRLTAAQVLFVDRLRARIRRDTGARISRSEVFEALVDTLARIETSRLGGARSEERLREIMRDALLPRRGRA